MRAPHRPPVSRVCESCGKSFMVKRSVADAGGGRFCSRACKDGWDWSEPLPERFWPRVNKDAPGGCWLWTGPPNGHGYGTLLVGGVMHNAHRVAWELTNGPVPDGLFVLHDCPGGDNPLCVNPAHMFLGTQKDNMADAARKGRTHKELPAVRGDLHWTRRRPDLLSRGESHSRAKYTDAQLAEIRGRHAAGERIVDLMHLFGISRSQINRVLRGQSRGTPPSEQINAP